MELRQLEAVVKIAESGSFTRAAEELSLTQPAITRQIGALETELKARLFDRLGRRVEPTAAGIVLQQHAQAILRMVADASVAVRDVRAGTSGRLQIGASSTAATYLLPPLLRTYRAAFPDVDVSVRTGQSARIAEMVAENTVDLGLVMDFQNREGLRAVHLAPYEIALIVDESSPLAGSAEPVKPEALGDLDLVLMPPGASLRRLVESFLGQWNVPFHMVMELDNVEAIKQMVAAGMGASIMPRLAIKAEVESGQLVALPIEHLDRIERSISAIYRTDKYVTAAMSAFIETAREGMSGGG